MKKNLLLIAAMLFVGVVSSFAQEKKVVIKGTFTIDSLCWEPKKIEKVFIEYFDDNDKPVRVAEAKVVDKKFSVEVTPKNPHIMYFINGFDNGSVILFLDCDTLDLSINGKYPVATVVKGSPLNDYFRFYRDEFSKDLYKKTEFLLDGKKRNPNDDYENIDYFNFKNSVDYFVYKASLINLLYDNVDSEFSPKMADQELTYLFKSEYLNKFIGDAFDGSKVANHPYTKQLNSKIAAASIKPGEPMPDIEGFDVSGKPMSLSSLKGKYVLIDFWASWCGPCRREFPHLKTLMEYAKNRNDFAILSYSLDSKQEDWEKAINTNNLKANNWYHISTLLGWGSDAVKKYNVNAVPTTYLIDKEGNLVRVNLRGEDMVNKIKQLLEKK